MSDNIFKKFLKSFVAEDVAAPEPVVEQLEKNNDIIDELRKEAMSYEINPYDIANSEMMQSVYDSAGKEYYLEILEDGKIGYKTLEHMSKHPLISSIVQTRVNQVAEFAQYSNDDDLGFRIKLRDDKEEPSDSDIKRADEIKRFIQDCGSETLDFELTFEGFVRQIIRDSLIYDQCCFEVVRNRRGIVTGFLPVDASTIRRTKLTKEEKLKGRRDPDKPSFCQVIEGRVVAEFGQKDLCFGVRRPRTSMKVKKYGYPELEELLYVLRNLESAEIFNAANFNNGISANGIIAVKSKMDPKMFRVFRREFYQLLTGVNNAKRTPLIQLDPESGEDINSINLTTSNKEMEYNAWVSYLIKELCAVYQMDPAEIGFVFGSEGQSSSLIQADPATRVIMGREKGLRPLIRSLQSWINKYIIYQIDPRFELEFVGLDSLSAEAKIELESHRMKYMTLNEIRALHDLEEVEDGDIIAAHYGSLKAKEMQHESAVISAQLKADASVEQAEIKAESTSKNNDDEDLKKNDEESLEKKFNLRAEECVRSDGKKGKYILQMETKSGEIREFCHFDIDEAQRHISIIETASSQMDKHSEAFENLVKAETYIAPDNVAAVAQRALDAKEEHGDEVKGGTQVGWTRARQLADQKPMSYDTIKRMKAFFDRHEKNQDPSEAKDPEWWKHASYVSWLIWGGDPARSWAEKIIEKVEGDKND